VFFVYLAPNRATIYTANLVTYANKNRAATGRVAETRIWCASWRPSAPVWWHWAPLCTTQRLPLGPNGSRQFTK
jgi:hypothetical protein